MYDLLRSFTISDRFFGRYERLVKEVVLPYQEKVLKDEVAGAEKSHAIANFKAAAYKIKTGNMEDEFYGMVFQDSDVAKWLEASAYSMFLHPDKEMEERCNEIIELIKEAQQSDGYLNTYFTVKEPDKRWTNLQEGHELYCAGHMMEAAAAFAECLNETKLLDIMCKMADHIYQHFIVDKAEGYPGHPEVELALMRLYHLTDNRKYLELAEHFINVRGVDSDYFIKERKAHPWTVWGNNPEDKEYAQVFKPVREQKKAVGHAVRAVYLYSGMADVALETGDESLVSACKKLWENIVNCRMYVTGAIGSAYEGEAFTKDYHLPNDTAYAETCAAVGLIFFAKRMLNIEKKSEYADVMERALYNCVLAGMQLDGQRFFYVNPLEVIPGISGEAANQHHVLPQRPKWFTCACCPPNVARLLASIGRYAWSQEKNTVYSHLFIGGELKLTENVHGSIHVTTDYPFGNKVTYRFHAEGSEMKMTLALRLPAFSKHNVVRRNGEEVSYEVRDGYAYVTSSFSDMDEITLELDMSIRRIYANSKVSADSGKMALSRGPLIYCAEGIDNGDDVLSLQMKKDGKTEEFYSEELNGVVKVRAEGYRMKGDNSLYSFSEPVAEPCMITMIPYYAWGNRGLSEMRVWMPSRS